MGTQPLFVGRGARSHVACKCDLGRLLGRTLGGARYIYGTSVSSKGSRFLLHTALVGAHIYMYVSIQSLLSADLKVAVPPACAAVAVALIVIMCRC